MAGNNEEERDEYIQNEAIKLLAARMEEMSTQQRSLFEAIMAAFGEVEKRLNTHEAALKALRDLCVDMRKAFGDE